MPPALNAASIAVVAFMFVVCGCSENPPDAAPARFEQALLPDLLARAEQAISEQRPQEAVDLLVGTVSQPSVDPRVRFVYGKALLRTGSASLAIWSLERAAAGKPADSEEALLHAQALISGGDPLTARRVLDRLIEEAPGNETLLRLRSRANQAALDHDGAIADLQTVIGLAPNDLSVREGYISLLLDAKRVDEARTAVAALNERVAALGLPAADRARYCVSEALFELQEEDVERSRALFEKCLAAYPDEPNVILPWCHFLEQTGELGRAIEILQAQVDKQEKKQSDWTSSLVSRLVAAGRREEADALLLEAADATSDPSLLFQLADYRIEWGALEEAREAAFRAIVLQSGHEPDEPDFDWSKLPAAGRFALGDLLIRIGDEETVVPLIESLEHQTEAADFESVYPILLEARRQLERGASRDALALFEESFRYWPSNVASRYLAGRAAMELGEFDQGLSLYRDAFRAEPTGSDAGIVLARMQAAEGHLVSAAETISTLLGEKADDPEALLLFAQLTSQLGAFENAASTRADLAKFPDWMGVAHREAALEIARRQNVDEAIEHLQSAADLDDPLQYEALSQWVAFQLQDPNRKQSVEAVFTRLDRLVRIGDGAAQHWLVRARADRLLGDLESARESVERAVSRDPSLVEAWLELGALALADRDLERARSAFDQARTIEPSNELASIGLADIARERGDEEEATQLYRRTLVLHPWQARAALELARSNFERGSTSEQILIWSRWAARFGGELVGEAAELLGRIRLARGESREAVLALQVAARESASPSRPLLLLARALVADGDEAQALSTVERALGSGSFANPDEAAEAAALLASLRKGTRS